MKRTFCLCVCCAFVFMSAPVFAQGTSQPPRNPAQPAQNSSLPQTLSPGDPDSAATASVIQQYHKLLSPETALYNGGEYLDYTTTLKTGYPYFGPDAMQEGWVLYDGMRFDHVHMWFDLITQSLVIPSPENVFKIELLKSRLQAFDISGHYFVHLQADSAGEIHAGFYEQLFRGNRITLYKKSTKKILESTGNRVVEKNVEADSSYYLEKNGRFFPFSRKSQVNSVLGNRKKEVAAYLRKNDSSLGRSLRNDKDATLLKIVTYYDGL